MTPEENKEIVSRQTEDDDYARTPRKADKGDFGVESKKEGKAKKIILGIVIALVAIIIILVIVYLIMRETGKKTLYEAATKYETPNPQSAKLVEYKGKKYKYNEDILTFLVMGTDVNKTVSQLQKNKDYTKGGQADTLFLVIVNPHTRKINLMSINRNSMADVDIYDKDNNYLDTQKLQICLQHGFGSGLEDSCERQIKAVSDLMYNIPIHGYMAMDLPAIARLNDIVGGVEVEVLENIPSGSNKLAYGKGKTITLSGKDAYEYVKYRDTKVFDSNSHRMARQKQYLKGLLGDMLAHTKEDITFPLKVMDAVSDYLVTDIDASKMTYLVSTFMGYDIDFDNIYSVPGETIYNEETGFEEYHVDEEALQELVMNIFYDIA